MWAWQGLLVDVLAGYDKSQGTFESSGPLLVLVPSESLGSAPGMCVPLLWVLSSLNFERDSCTSPLKIVFPRSSPCEVLDAATQEGLHGLCLNFFCWDSWAHIQRLHHS